MTRRCARLLAVALLALTVRAETPLPAPGEAPWAPFQFAKIERHTVYVPVTIDDVSGVRAESECSASALMLPQTDVDLADTPRLRWRWRIEEALDLPDERSKGEDDFAARVYVGFRFDPARASLPMRLARRIATRLYGENVFGSALVYVWTSRVAPGTTWNSPYTSYSKMVALGRGPGGAWTAAEVDVLADYRRLFGIDPPDVTALAIMTDADDTCGRAVAAYADFAWRGPDGGGGTRPGDA